MSISVRTIYLIALSATFPIQARAEDFTNAIHAYLQQRVEGEKIRTPALWSACRRTLEQHSQLRENG